MDIDKMLADAQAEHAELTDRLSDLQRLIGVLLDMANGGSKGDENRVVTVTTTDYPKPRDAVLDAISSRPGVLMEPKDVTAIVRELGVFNPGLKSGPTAYTTALSRLADEPGSKVERRGDQYIFLTPADVAAQMQTGEV